MAIGPRLDLRQNQSLVMTPQLRQAIKLLQLTNLELSAFVAQEVERNPLLDLAEPLREMPDRGAPDAREPVDRRMDTTDPSTAEDAFVTGRESLYDEAPADRRARSGGGDRSGPSTDLAEISIADRPSLRDHLLAQLGMMTHVSAPLRAAAMGLVDELDPRGYLVAPLFEIAGRYGVRVDVIEEALSLLQTCEPAGIGARNLAECLSLQLRDRGILSPDYETLLDHLHLLAGSDFASLARQLDLSRGRIEAMAAQIRALDPKPGLALFHDTVMQAEPDVFVRPGADSGWEVEINTETLPRVLINERYAVSLSAQGEEVAAFVSECRANANWLLRAMNQRATTILRAAQAIVAHQDGFFREGVAALRPLTMLEIAEKIGTHESTVSRVVNGKFLHCPRGMFELRFFFVQGLGPDKDGASSATAVQDRIRRMIAAEPPDAILSDDRIAEVLHGEGVDIARRTVAKYREGMGIPSSVQRRRQKSGLSRG